MTMVDQIDFVILHPHAEDVEIIKLKSFFEEYGLSIKVIDCSMSSLAYLIENKIKTALVYDIDGKTFAQDFIIEASVKKIFHQTTFYYLFDQKPEQFHQIKLMTLGYSGFLTLPFSPLEAQNTIDINDCIKAA
jgi:hypothetical protein